MGKVLLVDDEPDFVDVLSLSLLESGFLTQVAYSGVEALSILKKEGHSIDCILSDYYMPQMRGDELAMMIRHQSEVPIILMTSDPNIQYEKLYRSGISGLMTKPINAESFTDFLKVNDLHINGDAAKQRKYLRKLYDTSGMSITISNGRTSQSVTLSNISSQGLGLLIDKEEFSLTTVQFSLEKNDKQIKGYMHCRWKASNPGQIKAGFEFDSITKKNLSKDETFHKWLDLDT